MMQNQHIMLHHDTGKVVKFYVCMSPVQKNIQNTTIILYYPLWIQLLFALLRASTFLFSYFKSPPCSYTCTSSPRYTYLCTLANNNVCLLQILTRIYFNIFFQFWKQQNSNQNIFLIWKKFVHLLEMILVFSESALTCSESRFAQLTQTSMKPRNTVVSIKWHILRNVLLICSAYHENTLYVLEWMELLFSYLKQQHATGYKKNVSFMLVLVRSNNKQIEKKINRESFFFLVSTFEQFLNKSRFLSNFPLPHANNLFISLNSRHLHPDTN